MMEQTNLIQCELGGNFVSDWVSFVAQFDTK
jgi:hypothetical protein